MKNTVIYIHGQGGNAGESEHYKALFPGSKVVGLDYLSQTPWEAKTELPRLFDEAVGNSSKVVLIANSIGAYFAMCALSEKNIEKAYFISPIVDMERLICDMMAQANVSEAELCEKGTVGTLSWEYLCYVRAHPIDWKTPTHILYGERDFLTSHKTAADFAEKIGAKLTVMKNGEHWFHTAEQMRFLDEWIRKSSILP